jgi:hypothetical protein
MRPAPCYRRRYTCAVNRRNLAHILCLALVLSLVTPGAAAVGAWFCEGRACGPTRWSCCCEGPAEGRDSGCETPAPPETTGACAASCECVWIGTVTDAQVNHAAAQAPLPNPAPPLGVALWLPPTPEAARSSFEPRGPPIRRPYLCTPSLRAPPRA